MKIVKKEESQSFKNGEACIAYEYAMGDEDINGAVVEITGRYPEKGRTVNTKCKELGYVIKGEGRVVVEDKEIALKEGDLVLIEPNERFYWEGVMTVFVPCAPAWNHEQYKEVD